MATAPMELARGAGRAGRGYDRARIERSEDSPLCLTTPARRGARARAAVRGGAERLSPGVPAVALVATEVNQDGAFAGAVPWRAHRLSLSYRLGEYRLFTARFASL